MAFKDIAHWALIGIGSVLSVIPAVGPLVGGGIIAAGAAVPLSQKTVDPVSSSSAALAQALNNAQGYGAVSSGTSFINLSGITAWISKNFMLILAGIAAIIFIPKLFKRK